MFKLLFVLSLLLAIGCGRTLSGEAIDQAKIAIESGDYARGSLLLVMGCEALHTQSIYLLQMMNYQESDNLLGMIHAWIGIYEIDASIDFIQEKAYQILRETVDNVTITNRQ